MSPMPTGMPLRRARPTCPMPRWGEPPTATGSSREMTTRPEPAEPGEGPKTGPSLTIKQIAERLNVANNTVRNAIKKGQLTAYKFMGTYRVREEDLAGYIASCRVEARGREPEPPTLKATTLKHLDGARLRAAWTAQGVRVPRPGGDSARSSGSTRDPSTGTGS
jgi:excisionase family DNA binding protein